MFVNLEAILSGKTRALVVTEIETITAPVATEYAPDIAAPAPVKGATKGKGKKHNLAPVIAPDAPALLDPPALECHALTATEYAGAVIAPDTLSE